MGDKCQKCVEEKMNNEQKFKTSREHWMFQNGYAEDDEGFVIVPCECGHTYCTGWKPIARKKAVDCKKN